MRYVIIALLILGVIASVGLTSVTTAANSSNTVDIAGITDNPDAWIGQEVTVEGCVGFIMENQFGLWNDAVTSMINVKSPGTLPRSKMLDRVKVVGSVRMENVFGQELPYIFAESWEYI